MRTVYQLITLCLLSGFLLISKAGRAQLYAQRVHQFLRQEMKKQGIPGLQVVVIQQNKIRLSLAIGQASVQFAAPSTKTTLFSINSIAKVLAATAIMQLVEARKLTLDAPIATYLDDLPTQWQRITIKQLLSHTSGLPDIEDESTDGLIGNRGADSAWALVRKRPLQFQAGEQFSYIATNYVLLSKLIERCSGHQFADFIHHYQFEAVGMARTRYGNSYDVVFNQSPTYSYGHLDKQTGQPVKTNYLREVYEEFPALLWADAGVFSTAEEVAHWLISLQTGQLLKHKESVDLMQRPVKLNNGSLGGFGDLLTGYGLGWPVVVRSTHPAVGAIGGGRAAFLVYPQEHLSIILLTNLTGCSPELLVDKLAQLVRQKK